MTDKRYIAFIVGGIVLLVLAGLLGWYLGTRNGASENEPDDLGDLPASMTREAVPDGVTVPGVGDPTPENVAPVERKQPSTSDSQIDRGEFRIRIENDMFVPDTVIVYEKEIVRIYFTAVDKDYDFTQPDYGLRGPLPMGQEKAVEFQGVSAGKFMFYCSACGGPEEGPIGYVIVVPSEE